MSAEPETEETEVGEQTLIDGVRPVTLGDRLNVMTRLPIMPKRNPNARQKPCDIGLFDEVGRAQIDLIDFINSTNSPQTKTAKQETTP